MAGAALALPLDEPHLDIMPRTRADTAAPSPFEHRPGGAATVRARTTADAFSQPSANIGFEGELTFKGGNGLLRKLWVSAPASTLASKGLGPLYNARSCQRCHLKDGRGHPPEGPDDTAVSMFLRLSVPAGPDDAPAIDNWIATAPDPNYGTQLQDFALPGHASEGRMAVTYNEAPVALFSGEVTHLRHPSYDIVDLGYGPLAPGAMLSPRVAPQMIGLGLLEAIPAADILSKADPDDADSDGISGRAQIVPSVDYGIPMLGRFGHKAGTPTIREQTASAFAGDIGISTPLFPAGSGECTGQQTDCLAAPHGDGDERVFELDAEGLDLVTFYSRNLAVPVRRNAGDPQVLRGKQVFHDTGCAACHTPAHVTHRLQGDPAQSFQLIWPYADLLLHHMGEDLADHRPEGRATGTEWRTAPLWGIGLTETVSGQTYFLHDGRARSLLEAVLWHGEA